MELVFVAALGRTTRVIGRGLDLPWHLPADLRHFKALTRGETLLMGRRTFDALVHQTGGPLPERETVVVSRHGPLAGHPDVAVYASPEAALGALAGRARVVVAGGGELYAHLLPRADRLELTLVDGDFAGDVFFPPYEALVAARFTETRRVAHAAEGTRPGFAFVTYVRRMDAAGAA